MKDPKVVELVTNLGNLVKELNSLDAQLQSEGVRFSLERGEGGTTSSSPFKIKYLTQTVKYDEELWIEP